VKKYAFPIAMILGLGISTFIVVTALQAAPFSSPLTDLISLDVPTVAVTQTPGLAEQGRMLFVAKGCLVCHNHPAFAAERHQTMFLNFDDVPTLASLKIDADYLKRWLHDPRALKPTTQMPNLNLSDEEIDALVAFLTTSGN